MFQVSGSPPNVDDILHQVFHRRAKELTDGGYLDLYCGEPSGDNGNIEEANPLDGRDRCGVRISRVFNGNLSTLSLQRRARLDASRPVVQPLPPTNVSSARTRIRRCRVPES